jgi:hypothetical protein
MIRVSTRPVAATAGTLLVAAFSLRPSLAQAPSGNTVAPTGARVIDGATAAIERGKVPKNHCRSCWSGKPPGFIVEPARAPGVLRPATCSCNFPVVSA